MTDELDATYTPEATQPADAGPHPRDDGLPSLDATRYRVDAARDAQLGKGGQGVVWRARDEVLRREVALKVLRPEVAEDAAALASFLREARLTALLEHPGIVPLHDVGAGPDGRPTLVLRRIAGRTLAEVLDETRTLDERLRLVPAVLRACQAVAFAHARGVVHRDLKPQNVMLGELGQTYVVDWGLARVEGGPLAAELTDAVEAPGVLGTPAYMSPEQALGLAADARSDVWGLGACLYQVLTGVPPLTGGSIASVLGRAAEARVAPVRELTPGVPADLAAICQKALSPGRDGRYESAVALANDLEAWLGGRAVSAREYTPLELVRRALAANRLAFGFAAVGVVAVALVVVFDEARVRRERNDARAFARSLLLDSARFAQTTGPDVEFLDLLSRRTRQWLGRHDLDLEERAALCSLLVSQASYHRELSQPEQARPLLDEAVRLARAGLAEAPTDSALFACQLSAQVDLVYADVLAGRAVANAAFAPLDAALAAWTGPSHPSLTLTHADLLNAWADAIAAMEPRRSAELSVASARRARALLGEDSAYFVSALQYGSLGVTGLWGLGRRAEALELAQAFADAAQAHCGQRGVDAARSCQAAVDSLALQLSWSGDPRAEGLRAEATRREAQLLARSPDSRVLLLNATFAAFERGDFQRSAELGARLRDLEALDSGVDLLAAVLAGREPHAPLPVDDGDPMTLLASALSSLSRQDASGAATRLRAIARPHLWFQLDWTPHPAPALEVPAPARAAWVRFLDDFTRAYGAADEAALNQSVVTFADALEALPAVSTAARTCPSPRTR